MDGRAIAASALSQAGLGMLTADFGRARLAGIMNARGETRSAEAEAERAAPARGYDAARATRP